MGVERWHLGLSQCKMREVLNSHTLLALHFERSFNDRLVLSTEVRPKLSEIERSIKTYMALASEFQD